jgi:hypothetical protein
MSLTYNDLCEHCRYIVDYLDEDKVTDDYICMKCFATKKDLFDIQENNEE